MSKEIFENIEVSDKDNCKVLDFYPLPSPINAVYAYNQKGTESLPEPDEVFMEPVLGLALVKHMDYKAKTWYRDLFPVMFSGGTVVPIMKQSQNFVMYLSANQDYGEYLDGLMAFNSHQ